tara:strand:+ start:282 stop:383 length:102 start_codon:yes stop_codon:yes gene_type:complete
MNTAAIRKALGLDNLGDPFLRDVIIRKHNNRSN